MGIVRIATNEADCVPASQRPSFIHPLKLQNLKARSVKYSSVGYGHVPLTLHSVEVVSKKAFRDLLFNDVEHVRRALPS